MAKQVNEVRAPQVFPDLSGDLSALVASVAPRDTAQEDAARAMYDEQQKPSAIPNDALAALAALSGDALAALLKLAASGATAVSTAVSPSTAWPYPALPSDAYKGGVPLTTKIVAVKRGAKREGTQAGNRYARYPQEPFTLAECLKVAGGPNTADFLYDIRHGYIVAE